MGSILAMMYMYVCMYVRVRHTSGISIRQHTSAHVRIYNTCMCRCRGCLHIIAPLCESSAIVRDAIKRVRDYEVNKSRGRYWYLIRHSMARGMMRVQS